MRMRILSVVGLLVALVSMSAMAEHSSSESFSSRPVGPSKKVSNFKKAIVTKSEAILSQFNSPFSPTSSYAPYSGGGFTPTSSPYQPYNPYGAGGLYPPQTQP